MAVEEIGDMTKDVLKMSFDVCAIPGRVRRACDVRLGLIKSQVSKGRASSQQLAHRDIPLPMHCASGFEDKYNFTWVPPSKKVPTGPDTASR